MIDEAGAIVQMQPAGQRKKSVRVKDIEHVVATIARIPPRSVSTSDRDRLETLERDLQLTVFGQDAGDHLARVGDQALARRPRPAREAGRLVPLRGPDRRRQDRGREAARLGARHRVHPLRHERVHGGAHGLAPDRRAAGLRRLRPGRARSTDAIRKTPHAVLLLDEIEKAHPNLFSLLLQVMDHATLTDNNGRQADFRHVILIMTTNAGAQEMAAAAIGFGGRSNADQGGKAIERLFSPEFRNRLDAIISLRLAADARHRARRRQVHDRARRAAEREARLRAA